MIITFRDKILLAIHHDWHFHSRDFYRKASSSKICETDELCCPSPFTSSLLVLDASEALCGILTFKIRVINFASLSLRHLWKGACELNLCAKLCLSVYLSGKNPQVPQGFKRFGNLKIMAKSTWFISVFSQNLLVPIPRPWMLW